MNKLSLTIAATVASIAGLAENASAQATVYGLSSTGTSFVTFNLSASGFSTSTPITGLSGGETIKAIDFRPTNELLYGYSSTNRLFTISTAGAATLVTDFATTPTATPAANSTGSDSPSAAIPTGAVNIDVNPNVPNLGIPVVGALRIISTSGGNTRYAFPATNVLNLDDTLTFTGGGVPTVVGAAYTNNDINPGSGTSLFYLEASTDRLYSTLAPNDGVLFSIGTVGALGIDLTSNVGFDIPVNGTTNAYASANGNFYSIDLTLGTSTLIGSAGALTGISDIAIVPESSTYVLLIAGGIGLFVVARRRNLAAV